MRILILASLCLYFTACSATKNLPATCEKQLQNLTVLENNLVAVRAALEICAAQPPVEQ